MRGRCTVVILMWWWSTIALGQMPDSILDTGFFGYSYIPAPGQYVVQLQGQVLQARSQFDDQGEEHTYDTLTEYDANPVATVLPVIIGLHVSVTEWLGVHGTIPVVVLQEFALHPDDDVSIVREKLEGETGFGDLTMGLDFLAYQGPTHRLVLHGGYTAPTGSSPYDQADWMSTGMGHATWQLGLAGDMYWDPKVVLSLLGEVRWPQATTVTRQGVPIEIHPSPLWRGQVRYSAHLTSHLAFGVTGEYLFADNSTGNGVSLPESNVLVRRLGVHVGYQPPSAPTRCTVEVGYLHTVSGVNTPQWSGFTFGVHFPS